MNRNAFAPNMARMADSTRACASVGHGAWHAAAGVAAYSVKHTKSSKRTTLEAFRHST